MGGIVVKQVCRILQTLISYINFVWTKALIIAKNESGNYPGIADSVKAILFLGTPHQGSTTARYGEVLAQIANVFVVATQTSRASGTMRSELLRSLRASENGLLAIAEDFRVHTARIKIFSFIEQKSMKGLNQRVRCLTSQRFLGINIISPLALFLSLNLLISSPWVILPLPARPLHLFVVSSLPFSMQFYSSPLNPLAP
jgi:hypothetical protein